MVICNGLSSSLGFVSHQLSHAIYQAERAIQNIDRGTKKFLHAHCPSGVARTLHVLIRATTEIFEGTTAGAVQSHAVTS